MLVGAVVVHHHMQLQICRKLLVQLLEEFDELLMTMPCIALSDHFSLRYFKCCKECRSAVSLVIVRHCSAAPALQRQSGLGAIQGLNLGLFINTQHQSLGRWIEIKAYHVG